MTVKAISQDSNVVIATFAFDCKEIVDFDNIKNNRLLGFERTDSGTRAEFVFRLACCAEYNITGQYSGDSLFLNSVQINNLQCDCSCYYRATLLLPSFDPKLVFWKKNEFIGLGKTEYIESPISFDIYKGDTINYINKRGKAQGKFIYGTNLEKPSAVLTYENDTIVSGWQSLEYHKNGTPRLVKKFNLHNLGDRAVYSYLDTNQQLISECYRYYPRTFEYLEFCPNSIEASLDQLANNNMKFIVFINDSLILQENGIINVDYNLELQGLTSMNNTVNIVLLEKGQYSQNFLSDLDTIKNEKVIIHRKELIRL
jgi:hypothetical protein